MEADFSGYATKHGLKCSDGRTITAGAFKHADGQKVPLVWQHQHNSPANVLGHAILENREDGVYAYGYFNKGQAASEAREAIEHGDISAMSIFANGLVEDHQKNVQHGNIREVSLVFAGANPGAHIENFVVRHSDGSRETIDDEVILFTGAELEHEDKEDADDESTASDDDKTLQDVLDTFDDDQTKALEFMLGQAKDLGAQDALAQSALSNTADPGNHSPGVTDNGDAGTTLEHNQEGITMRNAFEAAATATAAESTSTRKHLTPEQMQQLLHTAEELGSYKAAVLQHADEYGITNIDILFPDAKSLRNTPDFVTRRMEWVSVVLNGVHKTPFSRIKSLSADITLDTARAKGYVKGTMKKEEFFGIARRVTRPTTIYKKQKLDRDDIVDITEFDVVVWIKAEMRVMIDEEIARAILIGDGREVDDPDKIKDPKGATEGDGIRAIATDVDFYAHQIELSSNVRGDALVEAVLRARKHYKGSGNPTLFTTEDTLTDLLLVKDKLQRRLYPTEEELRSALRVKAIVAVEVMETETDLIGIMVNLADYTVGADRGGQLSMFDDFDIDFNQYKYLLETRISGALTKPKSAIVLRRVAGGESVTPLQPSFNEASGVITFQGQTRVDFTVDGILVTESTYTVESGESVLVEANPKPGFYFPGGTTTDWVFERSAA